MECGWYDGKVGGDTRYPPPLERASMDLGLSPTHKLLLQSSKFDSAEAFCKEAPKLIIGAYMNKLNVLGTDVFAEPMIFYCIVF